ncbi:unnamed protein product [Mytilus coruscus]|uniref:Integrase catalytic domain-containing protein n=1 Tax=Mytilus coruscus TaxID=42192 RepID=A0A6J8BET6_MYTCO|nr:unnamed protein product [Mytilus coruscus]
MQVKAKSCYRVAIQETVNVPPNSEMIVSGESNEPIFRGLAGLIEPNEKLMEKNGLLVARSIVHPEMYNIPLRIININNEPCTLYKGTIIATCNKVNEEDIQTSEFVNKTGGQATINKGRRLPDYLHEVFESSQVNLDKDQSEKFKDLLMEYSNIFSKSSEDIGLTDLVEHTINTGNHPPVRQRPRRIPLARMKDAETEIQKMVQQDIIEPSSSPWNSNFVLVKKSDGSWRFCIDFRSVILLVLRPSYPLPRIDDTIDSLSGSKFFSTVDLKSGYYQIPVAKEDRPKTAFSFPGGGLWQFKRMPMGLCNSAPVFERLMETVLSGHIVSESGVATDPNKIQSVKDWPVPKSIKDVRSFLGLTSYYRKFILKYADKAKPLYKVTEKNQKFVWTDDCQQSFEELKTTLISAPILAYPTREELFILDTDASNVGMGAVLSKLQDGVEKLICYCRNVQDVSDKQSVTTTSISCINEDRPNMTGDETCHKVKSHVIHNEFKSKGPERNPDVLPVHSKIVRVCTRSKDYGCSQNEKDNPVKEINFENVSESQLSDDVISIIIQWKIDEVKPTWAYVSHMSPEVKFYWSRLNSLILVNGILYRKWESYNGKHYDLHIVLPANFKRFVLNQVHNTVTGGHLGVRKTLSKIKQRYFWYKMRQDVKFWCTKCDICASKKAPCKKPKAPMKQYLVCAPWERMAIDILGPLPCSVNNNRYLMVVQDYFSKWTEAIPIPDTEAVTVANKFVERIVTIFGVPLSIHSDQGSNFESHVFKEMCNILGIHKTRTTPFRPKSDGMVEKSNSTIETMLSAFVSKHQRDWDEYIYLLMLA